MTLEAKSTEPVDVFARRVSRAYSSLLAEAKRTAPVNKTPHGHVFDKTVKAISTLFGGYARDVASVFRGFLKRAQPRGRHVAFVENLVVSRFVHGRYHRGIVSGRHPKQPLSQVEAYIGREN